MAQRYLMTTVSVCGSLHLLVYTYCQLFFTDIGTMLQKSNPIWEYFYKLKYNASNKAK